MTALFVVPFVPGVISSVQPQIALVSDNEPLSLLQVLPPLLAFVPGTTHLSFDLFLLVFLLNPSAVAEQLPLELEFLL